MALEVDTCQGYLGLGWLFRGLSCGCTVDLGLGWIFRGLACGGTLSCGCTCSCNHERQGYGVDSDIP